MSKHKINLGFWGEKEAEIFLVKKGYTILETNFKTDFGEIDIIARIQGVIVFVEVKTRSNTHFGNPEEAITTSKSEHMLNSALAYMQDHPENDSDWRIDVIAVNVNKTNNTSEFTHFENAVSG